MDRSGDNALSTLQRAILLTALYGDLFDYPLTPDQLRRYLVVPYPGRRAFADALEDLIPTYLVRDDGLLVPAGRESTVAVRHRREQTGGPRWAQAQRYARWLRHVPFVRMVAVCGSQAAGNARSDADIDFFIITAPNRLWTVQVCAMFLRRFASLLSLAVCPNYFLTLESLEVTPRDLYHAREVAQAVPLWGRDAYGRFRAANRWVDELLPNLSHVDDRLDRLTDVRPSRLAGALEWLLRGAGGVVVERAVHGLLLRYYAVRLGRRGWRSEHLRSAYRRDRQEVVRGGYGPVVEKAFRRRVGEVLAGPAVESDLQRLFPDRSIAPAPDRLYADLFVERYGGAS